MKLYKAKEIEKRGNLITVSVGDPIAKSKKMSYLIRKANTVDFPTLIR